MPLDILETRRLAFLVKNSTAPKPDADTPSLVPNACFKRRRMVIHESVKPGMKRLIRFLELLDHYDNAPWASKVFSVNQMMIRRLTHSHLPLIAAEFYEDEKNSLEAIVNAPEPAQNVLWVTNRQQASFHLIVQWG